MIPVGWEVALGRDLGGCAGGGSWWALESGVPNKSLILGCFLSSDVRILTMMLELQLEEGEVSVC